MGIDLARYVMSCVAADNPDATPDELIDLQTRALHAAGLLPKG